MRKSAWRKILYGEAVLLRLSACCIGLLIISQAMLFKDNVRPYLSRVDMFEGDQISFQMPQYAAVPLQISEATEVGRLQALRNSKVMIIRMIKPANDSNIFVTINGKVIDDFRKGEVKLTVYEGDYVEIDAGGQKEPVQFVVNVPSNALISPIDGLLLEGRGEILSIGKIKFKN